MLINEWQYELTIWIWLGIAAGTFLLLMFVRAPYADMSALVGGQGFRLDWDGFLWNLLVLWS